METYDDTQLPRLMPAVEIETMPVATFRAPADLIQRLSDAAGTSRGGRSAVIREACERYLSERAA